MKNIIFKTAGAVLLLVCGMPARGSAAIPETTALKLTASLESPADGTHEVLLDDVAYVVTIDNGNVKTVRRNIFDANSWSWFDQGTISFIEEAVADKLLRINDPRFQDVKMDNGSWEWMKSLDKDNEISVTVSNSRVCEVQAETPQGMCRISFPIEYDKINGGGSRTAVEQAFIDGLNGFVPATRQQPDFTIDDLEKIADNMFVLEGGTYIIPDVNQNIYVEAGKDGVADFIARPDLPAATFANMINVGNGYVADLELTVAKHEYGKTVTLNVPLESFLQYCLSRGCQLYWGLEEISEEMLRGTLFCYNATQGYDHVVRMECNPAQLGEEGFTVKGHASLYIPTNNVYNLFEEYKPKKENEKIRWQ